MGSEVLLEQVQLIFSFRNKFKTLLACGPLVDNNTFSKMCIFKSLTGYTNYDPLRPASSNEIHMPSFAPIRTRNL